MDRSRKPSSHDSKRDLHLSSRRHSETTRGNLRSPQKVSQSGRLRSRSPLRGDRRDESSGRGRDSRRGPTSHMDRASFNVMRRAIWRSNRAKMRRRIMRHQSSAPQLSGGNAAPVRRGNRNPGPPKMRMDSYSSRNNRPRSSNHQSNAAINQTVVKARREASTRTKDIFWTKKLLDAEATAPNRWAHTGFKELYKEELGYPKDDGNIERERRSPRPNSYRNARSTSPKRKSPVTGIRSGNRNLNGRNSHRSRTKSPVGKRVNSVGGHSGLMTKRPPYSSGAMRRSRRSLTPRGSSSCSVSTITSRSRSGSYSGSSRSSSSFSSSSLSGSSVGSVRSRRRSSSFKSPQSFSSSSSVVSIPKKRKITNKAPTKISPKKSSLSAIAANVTKDNSLITTLKRKYPPPLSAEINGSPKSHYSDNSPVIISSPPAGPRQYFNSEVGMKSPPADLVKRSQNLTLVPVNGYEGLSSSTRIETRPNFIGEERLRVPSEGERSPSESSSEDDDDATNKMTLSERFGKLAQLSSQRQEYDGVRMKIVREGGQDKKVILEAGSSRSPPPSRSPNTRDEDAHERWLSEHKAEYDDYEDRYGQFRQWDPHRDLPRELPPNWDDVNVRYRYYKESGYFGDRSITMEDYLKWEDWWYRYRDWLGKYGDRESRRSYAPPYGYKDSKIATSDRWARRGLHRSKDRLRIQY